MSESYSADGTTWDFEPEGRDEYQLVMRLAGYAEIPSAAKALAFLRAQNMVGGYWCYNCTQMKSDKTSSTKYRCYKYGFPDKPHGCCKGHEEKPPGDL